jgi:hypothetical protein
MENFSYSPPDPSKRYGRSPVLTPQASVFVHGGLVLADGTVRGSSSRLLVEFPLERYELYAHTPSFQCNNVIGSWLVPLPSHHLFPKLYERLFR